MKSPSNSQIDKFGNAARELQTDDDPEQFAEMVRKLVKSMTDEVDKPKRPRNKQ